MGKAVPRSDHLNYFLTNPQASLLTLSLDSPNLTEMVTVMRPLKQAGQRRPAWVHLGSMSAANPEK